MPLKTLVALSEKADRQDRYAFAWPRALPETVPWMSYDLLSVAGTEVGAALSSEALLRLSRDECRNFFGLNVHGICDLMRGVLAWSHHPAMTAYSTFVEHFLIEEARHLQFFAEFCRRYGGLPSPVRAPDFPNNDGPEARRFLAFAAVLIFEEAGHVYNRRMMADAELPQIVRDLNRVHYEDEGRHIAAGREIVAELFDAARTTLDAPGVADLRERVRTLFRANAATYYSPRAYSGAGLDEPFALAASLPTHPARLDWHARATAQTVRFFDDLFDGSPERDTP